MRPFPGWHLAGLIAAAGPDADLLFPGGQLDLIEAYCDLADRRMEEAATTIAEGSLTRRVRAVLALRFAQNRDHKEAIRRAWAIMSLPGQARLAARCTARTVDAIWHVAGDEAADFSWYTKRATLSAVLGSVALFRLGDESPGLARTHEFVDRRIDDVMAFETWKREAARNPLLRPFAGPLGWAMGRIRAPIRPPDLPGQWKGEP